MTPHYHQETLNIDHIIEDTCINYADSMHATPQIQALWQELADTNTACIDTWSKVKQWQLYLLCVRYFSEHPTSKEDIDNISNYYTWRTLMTYAYLETRIQQANPNTQLTLSIEKPYLYALTSGTNAPFVINHPFCDDMNYTDTVFTVTHTNKDQRFHCLYHPYSKGFDVRLETGDSAIMTRVYHIHPQALCIDYFINHEDMTHLFHGRTHNT